MKFESKKQGYRCYAVSGFDSQQQQIEMKEELIKEIGLTEFNSFEKEIEREVSLGVFLSPPPRYVA